MGRTELDGGARSTPVTLEVGIQPVEEEERCSDLLRIRFVWHVSISTEKLPKSPNMGSEEKTINVLLS